MKAKKTVTRLLLGFVLLSIGFALGKEVTLRRLRRTIDQGAAASAPGDQVIVYYMYPAIRCVTCNAIEKAAHKVVHDDFAEDLQAGRLKWQVVNIAEDEVLAKRYNVASSTVVVVQRRDGREVGFARLDEVWPLAEKPDELSACVREAVRSALVGGKAP